MAASVPTYILAAVVMLACGGHIQAKPPKGHDCDAMLTRCQNHINSKMLTDVKAWKKRPHEESLKIWCREMTVMDNCYKNTFASCPAFADINQIVEASFKQAKKPCGASPLVTSSCVSRDTRVVSDPWCVATCSAEEKACDSTKCNCSSVPDILVYPPRVDFNKCIGTAGHEHLGPWCKMDCWAHHQGLGRLGTYTCPEDTCICSEQAKAFPDYDAIVVKPPKTLTDLLNKAFPTKGSKDTVVAKDLRDMRSALLIVLETSYKALKEKTSPRPVTERPWVHWSPRWFKLGESVRCTPACEHGGKCLFGKRRWDIPSNFTQALWSDASIFPCACPNGFTGPLCQSRSARNYEQCKDGNVKCQCHVNFVGRTCMRTAGVKDKFLFKEKCFKKVNQCAKLANGGLAVPRDVGTKEGLHQVCNHVKIMTSCFAAAADSCNTAWITSVVSTYEDMAKYTPSCEGIRQHSSNATLGMTSV